MASEDVSPSESSHRPVSHLESHRARRFLRSLAQHPFLAIVVEDGHVRLYEKGMDEFVLEDLLQSLERTIPEQVDDAGGGS